MPEREQSANEKDMITGLFLESGGVERLSNKEKAWVLYYAASLGAQKAEETGNPNFARVIREVINLK